MKPRLLNFLSAHVRSTQDWPEEWRAAEAAERRALTRRRTTLFAGLMVSIILAGTTTREFYLVGSASSVVTRIALLLCVWVAGCGLMARRFDNRLPALALVLGTLIACCQMVAVEGGVVALPWPSLMLFLLAIPLIFPVSLREMMGLAVVGLAGFYLAAVHGRPDVEQLLVIDRFLWLGYAAVISVAAAGVTGSLRQEEFASRRGLEVERERSEALLLNVMPQAVAEQLKSGASQIAQGHEGVSVLFADLVGFTAMSARRSPKEVVSLLNRIVTDFDRLAVRHGLEKIKTIGDCYMVASGIPEPREDHASAAAAMAVDLLKAVEVFDSEVEEDIAMRVGIHCGPVVAGVIGESKFAYDLWGDTVNVASRMESHGVPGMIQVTGDFKQSLAGEAYAFESRGNIKVKGRGELETFLMKPSVPRG